MSVEEAIGTLSVMFEGFDRETLLAVLDVNDGNLERTIDTLLSMQTDNETAARNHQENTTPQLPPPSPTRPREIATRKERTALPDDFLRVPGSAVDQEAQDRMLAEMLQNEFFRQQIQADRDITSYIGYDGRRYADEEHRPPEKSALEVANETMAAVGTKLSHMSEAVKGKVMQLYARYQARQPSDPSQRPLMTLSDDEADADHRVAENENLRRRQASKASPRSSTKAFARTTSHSKED